MFLLRNLKWVYVVSSSLIAKLSKVTFSCNSGSYFRVGGDGVVYVKVRLFFFVKILFIWTGGIIQ